MDKKMIFLLAISAYASMAFVSAHSSVARLICYPNLSVTMFRYISSEAFSHFSFLKKNDGSRDKVINELVRIFIVRSFVVLGELISKDPLFSDEARIVQADNYLIEHVKKHSLLKLELCLDIESFRKKISDQFGDGSFVTDERAGDIVEENVSIFVKNILQRIKNHEDSKVCIL